MKSTKILLIAASFIWVSSEPATASTGTKAYAEVRAWDDEGEPIDGPYGILTLEDLSKKVRITGTIKGLSEGLHGIHVHQTGDLSRGCTSAGPHLDPFGYDHAAPNSVHRHVGDLGNIEANKDGVAEVDIIDNYLTLTGKRGAIGRAIVVHEEEDDLGLERTEESLKTGSAGDPLACGVFTYNRPKRESPQPTSNREFQTIYRN